MRRLCFILAILFFCLGILALYLASGFLAQTVAPTSPIHRLTFLAYPICFFFAVVFFGFGFVFPKSRDGVQVSINQRWNEPAIPARVKDKKDYHPLQFLAWIAAVAGAIIAFITLFD